MAEFKLQDPGEGVHEAEILEVHVGEGETVSEGDTILTIETDKAAVEIPSPFTGTVDVVRVRAGDQVRVGDVLIVYTPEGEEAGEGAQREPEAPRREQPAAAQRPRTGAKKGKRRPAGAPVPAAPATRRLARELDVDLSDVEATGPEGRVTADDVRRAVGEAPAVPERPEARERPREIMQRAALPDFAKWGEIERVPLRSIRRKIARHMTLAWSEIPHVTHQDTADVTDLEAFRQEQGTAVEEAGGKLTLTVLVMKAAVAALKAYPWFNASLDLDAEEVVLKRYYHLGVAVDTEQGLIVPVLRDVDRKSITDLAVELTELAERTRRGEVKRDELQGGTFTITNPGPLGGTGFTPIINHPEVAILGLGRARWTPVVRQVDDGREITPRLMLPLCLAFDHRVNDGAGAARFVSHVAGLLADPDAFVLTV